MSAKLDLLSQNLQDCLGSWIGIPLHGHGDLSIDVGVAHYLQVMATLHNHPLLRFEQLVDLCGVDYSEYGGKVQGASRFAVVIQLLSITHNWRLRVRCFAPDNDWPSIPSIVSIWNSVNWFEREAFDLFGIVFPGHPDLRRLLTDYGFIGHPFRKDFPVSGHVEMRYDPVQKRVIYEPVTIEPREMTPRIVREEAYGDSENA